MQVPNPGKEDLFNAKEYLHITIDYIIMLIPLPLIPIPLRRTSLLAQSGTSDFITVCLSEQHKV